MADLENHAPDGGRVFQVHDLVHLGQAQTAQSVFMFLRPADAAFNQLNANSIGHDNTSLSTLDFSNGQVALFGDLLDTAQVPQTLQGRFNHVMGVVGAQAFGEDIGHSGSL